MTWACVCGGEWRACNHGARRWRGHPALVRPLDQWISENLPRSRDGFVKQDADLIVRRFDPGEDYLGWCRGYEVKTMRGSVGAGERITLEALNSGRMLGWGTIVLQGGNTPAALRHYPLPRPVDRDWHHLPEQPVVAERIILDGQQVTAPELEEHLRTIH